MGDVLTNIQNVYDESGFWIDSTTPTEDSKVEQGQTKRMINKKSADNKYNSICSNVAAKSCRMFSRVSEFVFFEDSSSGSCHSVWTQNKTKVTEKKI